MAACGKSSVMGCIGGVLLSHSPFCPVLQSIDIILVYPLCAVTHCHMDCNFKTSVGMDCMVSYDFFYAGRMISMQLGCRDIECYSLLHSMHFVCCVHL